MIGALALKGSTLPHGSKLTLTPQGLRGHNVSSFNLQWQILGRVKQSQYFVK